MAKNRKQESNPIASLIAVIIFSAIFFLTPFILPRALSNSFFRTLETNDQVLCYTADQNYLDLEAFGHIYGSYRARGSVTLVNEDGDDVGNTYYYYSLKKDTDQFLSQLKENEVPDFGYTIVAKGDTVFFVKGNSVPDDLQKLLDKLKGEQTIIQ